MRKNLVLFLSAASFLALTSCSSKLGALSADNFTVTPNPLETEGGKVPATINGKFPAKYMKRKAVVTVVPELRYADGQVARGQAATFQGEKVQGNDQAISYKVGGNYTMRSSFNYVPGMQKSELYLTFDAKVGKKQVEVPAVKVTNGVIATSELYKKTMAGDVACVAPDTFKRIQDNRQEAQVKFLINQANLRKSELKNSSVTEFVEMLRKINREQEKLSVKDIEVLAYASPEGGFDFNDRLADKRQQVSEKYVEKQLKDTKVNADVTARYTAQDWEGFQKLVQASNIQDKDVILRVLSMYQDPEEREQQIRNISAGFRELADGILPELRRSRLIINYQTIGRSDQQIKDQLQADAKQLSVEELLYAAALENDADKQEAVYKTTASVYPNDYRAYNNLAAIEMARGNNDKAKEYLQKAISVNSNAAEASANQGLIALLEGDSDTAAGLLAKGAKANGINPAMGALSIAQGKYADAERYLEGTNSNTAALAQIMNKNYAAAKNTLSQVAAKNGMTHYLMAIASASQGDNTAAAGSLRTALQLDPSLAAYAANDLELVNVAK